MATLTRIAAAVLIVLAVLLGIFAWTLSRRPSAPPPSATLAQRWPIVVATRALPAGQPIPPDALAVESMPVNPNGTFSDAGAIAGRTPTVDIAAHTPVFEAQLLTGIAERIRPGERAVAVRVDEANAVGDRVKPGNYVDVFFTLKRDGSAGGLNAGNAEIAQTQARLLMSKVRVLAFGDAASASNTNGARQQRSATNAPRTAVLAVPVEDVDKLALAETSGRLFFALRNPNDDDVVDPAAFAPYGGVVKTSASGAAIKGKDGGMDPDLNGSTRAAAGVALAELSGAQNATGRQPERSVPKARPVVTAQSGGNIEVIRGGHAETVAW
nr:Flp pilus assembly protein CpaB [Paraburkholderia phosphatilytica]